MFDMRKFAVLCIFLIAVFPVFADTASFLILYTNDMHDYIKPGPDNIGGVAYLAGYVASVRAERDDVMLLDGGDVMEKGDMVAYETQSRVMYEAMKKMGYTAGAIGNHDLDQGVAYVNECSALAGYPLLCINHFNEDGTLAFTPSTIVDVKGVKIGIIGMTNIRTSIENDGSLLAEEAKRLEPQVDMTVVVAHIGSRECAELSRYAPEVDLFLSAHTHELLKEPVVVPETKALIVQAGHYSRHIGHLEVTVDLDTKTIAAYDGKIVEMAHDTIKPDVEMISWIKQMEQEYCPEATEIVGKASAAIRATGVALLAANAIKE